MLELEDIIVEEESLHAQAHTQRLQMVFYWQFCDRDHDLTEKYNYHSGECSSKAEVLQTAAQKKASTEAT